MFSEETLDLLHVPRSDLLFAWRPDDTNATYHVRRQKLFHEHGAIFRVASGAPRGRWHIIACYSQFPRGHILRGRGSCNLSDAAGRLRTFATREAAEAALKRFIASVEEPT